MLGSVGLVALITWGAVLIVSNLERIAGPAWTSIGGENDGNGDGVADLVTGPPQSPTAEAPLDCLAPCLDAVDVELVVPTEADLAPFGLNKAEGFWLSGSTSATDFEFELDYWREANAEPAKCMFGNALSPIYEGAESEPPPADQVYYTSWNEDDVAYTSIYTTARFFPSSDAAAAYMSELQSAIDGCRAFVVPGDDWTWAPQLSPAPALELPPSVAAIGFVTDDYGSRTYATDLQRGDVVIRVFAYTDAWELPEPAYRSIVEGLARRLAEVPANATQGQVAWTNIVKGIRPLASSGQDLGDIETGPGHRAASEPTVCPEDCLPYMADSASTPSPTEIADFGFTEEWLDPGEGPVSLERYHEILLTQWRDWDATPDACFFTQSIGPVIFDVSVPTGDDGAPYFGRAWSNAAGTAFVDIVSFDFADSAGAERHIADLANRLNGCTQYELRAGDRAGVVEVIPAPIPDDLPDNVAFVGWSEAAGDRQFFTYELQRGQFVFRLTVTTSGDSTQADAAALASILADRLGRQPANGG